MRSGGGDALAGPCFQLLQRRAARRARRRSPWLHFGGARRVDGGGAPVIFARLHGAGGSPRPAMLRSKRAMERAQASPRTSRCVGWACGAFHDATGARRTSRRAGHSYSGAAHLVYFEQRFDARSSPASPRHSAGGWRRAAHAVMCCAAPSLRAAAFRARVAPRAFAMAVAAALGFPPHRHLSIVPRLLMVDASEEHAVLGAEKEFFAAWRRWRHAS